MTHAPDAMFWTDYDAREGVQSDGRTRSGFYDTIGRAGSGYPFRKVAPQQCLRSVSPEIHDVGGNLHRVAENSKSAVVTGLSANSCKKKKVLLP